MTVNELIARLSAFSAAERELPVLASFFGPEERRSLFGPKERRIMHDLQMGLSVQDVRTDSIVGFHPYHDQDTVRALRIT
jgi:hypothetical protein